MKEINQEITADLRRMARRGETVATMFGTVKKRLGGEVPIADVLEHLRAAFGLSLAEVKPVAAFSRNDAREIEDVERLEVLVMQCIDNRRSEWDDTTAKRV